MPVILVGVIGGTIAYGVSGLFLGPVGHLGAFAGLAARRRGARVKRQMIASLLTGPAVLTQ
jgi:hypothetical protein